MQATKLELTLADSKKVTCSVMGSGDEILYIPTSGPGTFYFKGLDQESFLKKFTVITYDAPEWAYRKPPGETKFDGLAVENIINRDHLVVQALKKRYRTDEIHALAFSAPGAIAMEHAKKYPKDFRSLVLIGVGITKLDASFSSTNKIFYEKADAKRIKAFETLQNEYKELSTTLEKDPTSVNPALLKKFGFKNDGQAAKKIKDKPHKGFYAGAVALGPKLAYDLDEEKARKIVEDHWWHDKYKNHVNGKAQQYFFQNVFPTVNPAEAIEEVSKLGIPTLFIYGDTDFVTPLPEETAKKLKELPEVTLRVIPESAHVTYIEQPEKFSQAVSGFVDSLPKKSKSVSETQAVQFWAQTLPSDFNLFLRNEIRDYHSSEEQGLSTQSGSNYSM